MIFNYFIALKFVVKFIHNLIIRYPVPKNLGYLWNYGSLSGLFLVIQFVTGIFLAMFYTPHIDYAFDSVDHIMHNVAYGWIIRLIHLNSASFFFLCVYIHMLRGLYFKSYSLPKTATWVTGVTIYILIMATAFLGYVLPWGQMSYWAATVITNFITVIPFIGNNLVSWVWGGFSINNATLNRFFCLHYLLPFIIIVFLFLHLISLHKTGSSNILKAKVTTSLAVKFYPYLIIKDLFTICIFVSLLFLIVFFNPELLNHSINYIQANALVTPDHIVPEWYFLPFYAILRCILQKEIGILFMFLSIIIFYLLPKTDIKHGYVSFQNFLHKKVFWIFACNFIFLGYLGSQTLVYPIIQLSSICTWIHFYYLFIFLPLWIRLNTYILYSVKVKKRKHFDAKKLLRRRERIEDRKWTIFTLIVRRWLRNEKSIQRLINWKPKKKKKKNNNINTNINTNTDTNTNNNINNNN